MQAGLSELQSLSGTCLGTSRWYDLDQPRINTFADVTEDWQFIHLDPARAAETPFGGTIAHGFLTLSMLSAMAYDVLPTPPGMTASVNYGFDKLRFLSPVPAGSRIRGTFDLTKVEEKGSTNVLAHLTVTVEIENHLTPALAANWLVLYAF